MARGIEDVAREAGVSTATVSRALRGMPNVTEATRVRVEEAARRLGYRPSPSAAALATGRTRTIGLLTPWINRWYFSNVIEGAERRLRAAGYDALLYSFAVSAHGRTSQVDPEVLRRRVDGILVVGLPLDPAEVQALEALEVPIVFVGTGRGDHPVVGIDDVGLARAATEYLMGLGHRRIGHITGTPDDLRSWTPPEDRRQGWARVLRDGGIDAEDSWAEFGFFDIEGGTVSTHRLLDRHPELTALFVASDEMAMGAMLAARERGLRVPEDLSIVGVDGHDIAELVGLTTMAQPVVQQGSAAAGIMLGLIGAEPAGPAPDAGAVMFPTTLVVRTTTAAPPV
ncbi:LacI family DNA-binding transcriptional regulator [Sanguibacter sp. HDW7]|uniref:LacI family DNA-binding transcriptional regulator n=1 Tax=Sanguibacter sp. HDW7 TaxID=2714931 RepID=UPI00140BB133|nr:LacI family DNA-binding transcriptional regulator [Sanguibacter sp. HDW7]QIK82271.1 LacI family transcriptional regulator [Sanguibacter sp. HDW7]